MPVSRSTVGLQTAEVGNDLINARNAQGWATLRKSLEELPPGQPFRFKAVVYRNDVAKNRNGWAIRPGHLRAFARSARGKPLLLNHDEDQVVGQIVGSKVEGTSIIQELEVRTDEGKDRLLAGGIPEFSIRLQRDQDTAVACSICGGDKLDLLSECAHWRGLKYDGQVAGDIYSSGTQAESSIVVGPAIPDTGPLAADDDEDDLLRAHQMRLARIVSAISSEDTMSDVPGGDDAPVTPDAEVEETPEETPEETEAPASDDSTEAEAPSDGDTEADSGDESDESDEDGAADAPAEPEADAGASEDVGLVVAKMQAELGQLQQQMAQSGLELEQAVSRADELAAQNRTLNEHLERLRGEQLADESRRKVRELRLEGRVVGSEDAIVEARIKDPEHFDLIMGFVKPNKAFSSIQAARAAAAEPSNGEAIDAAMLAHQARVKAQEMSKQTGQPFEQAYEVAWKELRNRQYAAQNAARSRHS